jgi:adenylate cyclase
LLDRLRQRKVVQWALAYLAGAFALLQAVDIVGQRFGWPEQAERLLIVALAVGFFVAVVLAWYHGERGPQRVTSTELSLLALLLAIGGGILWRVAAIPYGPDAQAIAPAGPAALGPASTAVLPFVNTSPDRANEYFSDGIAETLLNHLAQVPQLRVAARTSSFSFKGSKFDVRRIGSELGVASVVEGSVQQAGDTLRITAQLVRTNDGSQLWSRNYDRKAADLFAIQDEIAGSVTQALVGELLPKTRALLARDGTHDLAAYDAYTRGLEQDATASFASYREAESLMQQALASDPNYVDAMVGLVKVWLDMARTGEISEEEFRARSAPMLDRVEAIDPDNARLLSFRAEIAQEREEHELALRLARRAIDAAPGDARLHTILADIYEFQRDRPAALLEMDKAVALNPLDANLVRFRAMRLFLLGRLDEALQAALRSRQLAPNNPSSYWALSLIEHSRGNIAEAVSYMARSHHLDPADPESKAQLAVFLDDLGETGAADAWIADSRQREADNLLTASAATMIAYGRGDAAGALAQALKLAGRKGDEHHGFWHDAMSVGCMAAGELGRLDDIRAALASAGALPRNLTTAGFKAWVGEFASPEVRLRELIALRRCVFTQGAADLARRERFRDIVAAVEGADWEKNPERASLGAELRGDRAAMIAGAMLPQAGWPTTLAMREGTARMLGIADDPRIVSHFAEQRERLAQARAALPAALAREGVAVLPETAAAR